MALSYNILFQVVANHNYHEDGVAPDLDFEPSLETALLLKNNRLKFRVIPGGFGVHYQSLDGSTPFISLGDLKMYFIIRLNNAIEFLNFTNLDSSKTFSGKKKLYFQNHPVGTKEISHSLLDLVKPPVFTYKIPLTTSNPTTETISLELTHTSSGETLTITGIPANDEGKYETAIDLRKAKQGHYHFRSTTSISNDTETEAVFIDEDLSKQSFFGLIEISYSNSALAAYELVFVRKTTLWNYILVNKTSRADFNDILVKDNSTSNDPPYQSYVFEKQAGTITVSSLPAVKFQSKTTIPFYEKPKTDIELVKDVSGNELVILENLANPQLNQISSDLNESDIYVFV